MKYGILLPNGKTVARKISYSRNGFNAWVRINKVDFGIEKLDENDKLEETLLALTIAHSKLVVKTNQYGQTMVTQNTPTIAQSI